MHLEDPIGSGKTFFGTRKVELSHCNGKNSKLRGKFKIKKRILNLEEKILDCYLINPYRGLTNHGNDEKPDITAV